MLRNREMLSAELFGFKALTIATGMPAIHDSTTAISGDLGGQRPLARDHLGDAFGAEERAAETAGHDVAEPAQILHDQRVAEPELSHVAGAIGLAELGEALRARRSRRADRRAGRAAP